MTHLRIVGVLATLLLLLLALARCGQPAAPGPGDYISAELHYKVAVRLERAGWDTLVITENVRTGKETIEVQIRSKKEARTEKISFTKQVAPFVDVDGFKEEVRVPGDTTVTYLYPVGTSALPTTFVRGNDPVLVDVAQLAGGTKVALDLIVNEQHHKLQTDVAPGTSVDLSGLDIALKGLVLENDDGHLYMQLNEKWLYRPDRG